MEACVCEVVGGGEEGEGRVETSISLQPFTEHLQTMPGSGAAEKSGLQRLWTLTRKLRRQDKFIMKN